MLLRNQMSLVDTALLRTVTVASSAHRRFVVIKDLFVTPAWRIRGQREE